MTWTARPPAGRPSVSPSTDVVGAGQPDEREVHAVIVILALKGHQIKDDGQLTPTVLWLCLEPIFISSF